jgi:uncharacterized protein (TIGR00106 family)
MIIAEISVVPIGTNNPSLSQYVAECVKALKNAGVRHTLTPMGTIVEGTLAEVLNAVRLVHQAPFAHGAARVLTRVTIDERRDKEATAEGKVRSVQSKLGTK